MVATVQAEIIITGIGVCICIYSMCVLCVCEQVACTCMNVWVGCTPPICINVCSVNIYLCLWLCCVCNTCVCMRIVNVLCMHACVAYMSVYGCAHDKVSKSYRTKYTIANNCMIQWHHINCTCNGYL